jgi:ketosteroid isomerase-like protein
VRRSWPRNAACMPEIDDFKSPFLPRFIGSLRDFHNGDPEPHIALWSSTEPVTLFAIRGMRNAGTEAVTATFRRVASWFSDVGDYEWDLIAWDATGDSAYTVCVEHFTASVNGSPPEQFEVRSTHLFRREDGRWRAIHRHADRQPLEPPLAPNATS